MVIGDKTKKGEMLLTTIERLDLKSLTYAERLQYMKEGEERRTLYSSRYQLNKMIDDAKRLLLRYGVRPGRVDISDYTPVDDLSNDAVKVVEHSRQALDCMDKNNIEDAVYYSMLALNASWRTCIRPFEDITSLGRSRRKSLKVFADRRGRALRVERDIYWKPVLEEVENIALANKRIANNKSALARQVKKNLDLPDSVEAIRHRIEISW